MFMYSLSIVLYEYLDWNYPTVVVFFFFFFFFSRMLWVFSAAAVLFFRLIAAYQTRGTENGVSPEPHVYVSSLQSALKASSQSLPSFLSPTGR